jgi:Flp pilus assembly protein TadG
MMDSRQSKHLPRRRRAGIALIYITLVITIVFGFASLAMDYGRVQLAKTQLRNATDIAARSAAPALGNVATVQSLAIQYAAANGCDGTPVTLTANDVEFGDWDTTTRTFTILTGTARNGANAVRVTSARAVPLVIARAAGISTSTVHASSIASIVPPGFGLVGINYIKLGGNSAASYWSSTGSVGGNAGNIASNGNITSTQNSVIQGTIWTLAGATVSGVTANARRTLSAPLSYANGSASPYSNNFNDNSQAYGTLQISNGKDCNINANKVGNFPAGHYVFQNFSVANNGQLNILGAVTIYFYGTCSINGSVNTSSNLPKNLKLVGIPNPNTGVAPGAVTLGSQAALYANVYAPQSAITMTGGSAIYGAIVGKSIDMTGTSDIYYDLSLTGGSGVAQVVQ